MKVTLGVSNRHVHLTEEDYRVLFEDIEINEIKELVQRGQYASNQVLTIKTEKNEIKKVRILLPFRSYSQVELSKTDAYTLGINPPIRDSGDLREASAITLIGPAGTVTKECAIIAARHIHITPEIKQKLGIDSENVSVSFGGDKPVTFHNVKLKEDPSFALELHLDTDDANGSFLKTGDIGIIQN